MSLGELYREIIMDHVRSPRGKGSIPTPDIRVGLDNPTCGDEVVVEARLDDDGRLGDVKFQGEGCTISMAAASMMTETVTGMTLDEALALASAFKRMLMGEADGADLGELEALSGVRQFPMRVKCASLSFTALEKGIQQAKEASPDGDQ